MKGHEEAGDKEESPASFPGRETTVRERKRERTATESAQPYPWSVLSSTSTTPTNASQGETKRAGRKGLTGRTKKSSKAEESSGGKQKVKKAVFETTKKKEVGVSDLTLISKISNEAINENLKKRFENREIYVSVARDGLVVGMGG